MTINTEQLVTFCKKKGFIYPSSDIYGGVSGLYDYGHLGTKLKHNFENLWRSYYLNLDENFHEIETANIMHQKVFKASGHLENFVDPVAVSESGHFERADHLLERSLGTILDLNFKNISDLEGIKGIGFKEGRMIVSESDIIKAQLLADRFNSLKNTFEDIVYKCNNNLRDKK